ncbi:Transforming growth factor-beta-induced protein ig-h3-like Protein [Gryllus bimaculatus]|nr:Transforming growth factor-beta-induced protein ig-h3-like Protein [Gryllus bimaculatus]
MATASRNPRVAAIVAGLHEPFTIFTPRNSNATAAELEALLRHPPQAESACADQRRTLFANEARVLQTRVEVPNGVLVVLDGYLFPEDLRESSAPAPASAAPGAADAAPDAAPSDTAAAIATTAAPQALVKINKPSSAGHDNSTFLENVNEILSFLKSGVRVFRDFLSRSNVSHLLQNGEEYTVLVPTDHAFQRWHPIDWGFYPFSVPEFTEMIMTNHFIHGNLKQENIRDGQKALTVGGKEITFSRKQTPPTLMVEGAHIVNGDTPVVGGNIMFIGEVLFVNEGVVQRLHQENRDKETPPLLAFPWFGSQFLSHAFLALEENPQFTQITRFVNLADLAPHITGAEYTFFVPTDQAFRRLGLDSMPNNYLSSGEGFQVLLNHFVKGRLYKRDFTDGKILHTLGNKTIHIRRHGDNITVNDANIIESEVFVYNLGTMYYIDHVLFITRDDLPSPNDFSSTESSVISTTELSEVERVPSELTEENGTLPDILLDDDTVDGQEVTTTESNDLDNNAEESSDSTTSNSTIYSTVISNETMTEPRR